MARVVAYSHLGKRGRGSSEEWRHLARTVPGTLLRVATSESEGVLKHLEPTHQWLRGIKVADLLEMGCAGNLAQTLRSASLEDSRCEITSIIGLHAAAGHVLDLLTEHLGLLQGCDDDARARWQRWANRSPEAVHLADEALRRLRSAMTDLWAVVQALSVVSGRPPKSPPRVAWTSEAEQLVRHAADEVAAAEDAVRRMRHAVVLEFFGAWAVLRA